MNGYPEFDLKYYNEDKYKQYYRIIQLFFLRFGCLNITALTSAGHLTIEEDAKSENIQKNIKYNQ